MVKTSFKIGGLILLVLLCGGALIFIAKPKEPTFRGRPLDSWLEDIASTNQSTRDQAKKTFRELGAEVEPALTQAIQTRKESGPRLTLMLWAAALHLTKPVTLEAERHNRVGKAFHAMGAAGSNAIPVLTRLLDNPENADKAAYALAGIGPQAASALSLALTNANGMVRLNAAGALGGFHHESKLAVPNLIGCLKDPNAMMRQIAAQSLGQIAKSPDLAVPALISVLSDSNSQVRMSAAMALGPFGSSAKPALPMLIKLQSDANTDVSAAANQSISQISRASNKVSRN